MDKRWILILVILIIGLGSMYYIVDHSNTVGSAITTFSKTTITIPDDFSVGDSGNDYVELYNKKNSEKITIKDNGKGNTASKTLKKLSEDYGNNDYDNITNNTERINKQKVYNLYLTNDNGTEQISVFYRQNHTYTAIFENFKNDGNIEKNLKFIIETMTPDYKQGKD